MRVLLIEDEPATTKLVNLALSVAEIICDVASSGREGIELAKIYDYDLIILDLMLPDIGGYDVLVKIRSSKIKVPVLILSGLTDMEQKLKGLNSGADDYITKPFNGQELVARINVIVRRSRGHVDSVVRFDKVCVNLDTRAVEVDGRLVRLTNKEYAIFELLIMRKGSVLTKEMFLNHLYAGLHEPEIKIVDVFVCKLRKKLSDAGASVDYIETVWGRGYMLKDFEFLGQPLNVAESNKELVTG
jgi:DNA-binding response OmpR family regulator